MTTISLRELGTTLRGAGLTPRALAAWAGTDRLAALPARIPSLARREPVPAAAALALWVAGAEVALDRLRGVPIDALIDHGLAVCDRERASATVAIVPLGPSLLVCDRFDTADEHDLVAWPDDSSHHLVAAIPVGRRRAWLDLGCGSAFAQLARPELARGLAASDRNPRAVRYARIGAALSGIDRFDAIARDIAEPHEPADLITCNAPIPEARNLAIWSRAEPTFFAALWRVIRRCLEPGGEAVVHAARRAIPADLPGERVIVAYAPEFAVLWWRPDAPEREVVAARELTIERPHVDARDRDEALAARRS